MKEFHFDSAIEAYSEAIKEASNSINFSKNKLSIYYANRAFAQIKSENYGLGLTDAQESVKLNPEYERGYLRLGFTNEVLGHYKDSYNAYKRAFELSGNKDNEIYQRLVNVKKSQEEYLRQRRMELLHDDKERGESRLYKNWKEIQVEQSYIGPKL